MMFPFLATTVAGFAAFADAAENELEATRRNLQSVQRKFSLAWREQDILHRKRTRQWKQIDFKRSLVDAKAKQVALLAELGGLIGGFQMIMFYENQLVDPSTYWFEDAFLAALGMLCLFVSCLNICVMVFASIINFQVFRPSCASVCRRCLNDALYIIPIIPMV